MEEKKQCEILDVENLFNENKSEYKIPIYQRNFAWGHKEIEQLIEDISDSDEKNNYFLGSLIVKNIKENEDIKNVYEVIDGQQRLTTLYLVLRYLKEYLEIHILDGSLSFESREDALKALKVQQENIDNSNEEKKDENNNCNLGIKEGIKIIESYFKKKEGEEAKEVKGNIEPKDKNFKEKFFEKLKKTKIVRIEVPKGTDLNLYFERMNTRGEQLEFHEIAKAKLLGELESDYDKKIAALIWEACSDMNNYVQMNFEKEIREKIFSEDLSSLKGNINSFDELKSSIAANSSNKPSSTSDNEADEDSNKSSKKEKLIDILKNENEEGDTNDSIIHEQDYRFESIISFPDFILQVNKIINEKQSGASIEENSIEASLNEKKLLENIETNIKNNIKTKGLPENFIYNLLKYRVLFDKYVLKREYTQKSKENGEWSLKKIKKSEDRNKNESNISYVNTYEKDEKKEGKLTKTLQSCLRITYTSPKAMEWISIVLKECENDEIEEKSRVLTLLESYCKSKLDKSGYEKASGFGFSRIVFTYLDYLLYRDGYSYDGVRIIPSVKERTPKEEWNFKFRSSIEHFYPQNLVEQDPDKEWRNKVNEENFLNALNGFGNLALITVTGNSKFSNLPPAGKIESYSTIIKESLKLKIMEEMTGKGVEKWTIEKAEKHGEEMLKILGKKS